MAHSIILNNNAKGPGYWKLNSWFLIELEYIKIKAVINKVTDEYKNDKDTFMGNDKNEY